MPEIKFANYDVRFLHIEDVLTQTPPQTSPICNFFGKTVFGREHPAGTAFPLYPLDKDKKCFMFGSKAGSPESDQVELIIYTWRYQDHPIYTSSGGWSEIMRVKGKVLGAARLAGGDTYAIRIKIGDLYNAYEFYCDRDGSDYCGWWFKQHGLSAQIGLPENPA